MAAWYDQIPNYITAAGTIILGILALFSDVIKPSPKLKLLPRDLEGHPARLGDGTPLIFYNLTLRNEGRFCLKHRPVARNCRVLLVQINRKQPDGSWRSEKSPVPWQLCWSPSETAPALQTVTDEEPLDLGFIDGSQKCFIPRLYVYGREINYTVKPGEIVRYTLRIAADNYSDNQKHIFEVQWDGPPGGNIDEMQKYVIIRQIQI